MLRHARLLGSLSALLLAFCAGLPTTALAHERRPVAGRYQLVVGFLTEPAISGQMNGIDLRVTSSGDSRPVEGLEKTLKAEIGEGGARTMPLELQARFGQPGSYVAYFIPTREGRYGFHLSGAIDGAAVDESFESGPGRFDDVRSAQQLQFPDKLPDAGTAAAQVESARAEAALARTLALVGLAVGLAGLAVGATVLAMLRRSASLSAPKAMTSPSSRR